MDSLGRYGSCSGGNNYFVYFSLNWTKTKNPNKTGIEKMARESRFLILVFKGEANRYFVPLWFPDFRVEPFFVGVEDSNGDGLWVLS